MPKRVIDSAQALGVHAFAQSQRQEILSLLRSAGAVGISKRLLIFELGYTQCGARIYELEALGHRIRHEMRPGERYVHFILISELAEPQKKSSDWYERSTGKPRSAEPQPSLGPLFESVGDRQ